MAEDTDWGKVISKGLGIAGGPILSTLFGVGSDLISGLTGKSKRVKELEEFQRRQTAKAAGQADKLSEQATNQEAVRQAETADIRSNLEGSLLAAGGKAANLNNSNANIPMAAVKSAIGGEAQIAVPYSSQLQNARESTQNRAGQLNAQAGDLYNQAATTRENVTRMYEEPGTPVDIFGGLMKGATAFGLMNLYKNRNKEKKIKGTEAIDFNPETPISINNPEPININEITNSINEQVPFDSTVKPKRQLAPFELMKQKFPYLQSWDSMKNRNYSGG